MLLKKKPFILTFAPKLPDPVATNAVTPKLPALALPDIDKLAPVTKPAEFKLATLALPDIVTRLLVLSNVNAVLELALPASLNTTPVLEPGIVILPEILPETLPVKLPMKFGAVILPVAVSVPVMLAPALSTTTTFAVPALEIVTLPLANTFILLLPFVSADELIETNDNPPINERVALTSTVVAVVANSG